MEPRNFYFGKNADIVTGSANFAAGIAADYASLGLTSAQSTAFGALNTALQNAYSAAITPSTRTKVSIDQKDQAIKAMRASAINLAKIIYSTSAVVDSQLVSLGLLPRPVYTPRHVPTNSPTVTVLSVIGRMVKVRVSDDESERRGLPFGATGANLYTFIGPTPATDPEDYSFQGTTTRSTADILFPNTVASGATVWITAQWVSARGQRSIGSEPISFTLQGGPVTVAA